MSQYKSRYRVFPESVSDWVGGWVAQKAMCICLSQIYPGPKPVHVNVLRLVQPECGCIIPCCSTLQSSVQTLTKHTLIIHTSSVCADLFIILISFPLWSVARKASGRISSSASPIILWRFCFYSLFPPPPPTPNHPLPSFFFLRGVFLWALP